MATPQPTWGYTRQAWEAAKREALSELKRVARSRAMISYGELSRKIVSIPFEPDGHDFHGFLGQLSEESDADSKGMISALVVHKDDLRPGRGFFTLAEELGRDTSDRDRCWINELDRVYAAYSAG